MGFRARKSFKVIPGVRMTVTARGIGVSAGVRGARVSVNTSGRVTKTVGIPGAGISHVTTSKVGSKPQARATMPTSPPALMPRPRPGLIAPKWEKALYRVLFEKADPSTLRQLAESYPDARRTILLFEAIFSAMPTEDYDRARTVFGELHASTFEPQQDPFVSKYASQASLTLKIADGVTVSLPLDANTIGLSLAELHQIADDLTNAVEVVESLEPSTIAAVSLAELYGEQERWDDVIGLTDGLTNEDEPSMFLLIQRGAAFREKGYYEAAREAFKEALRVRSRTSELRNIAYVERGRTYLIEGKPAMARKDFERVMAENSTYPGLAELVGSTS